MLGSDITYFLLPWRIDIPPVQQKGDALMDKDILTVGSSTLIVGNGVPVTLSAIVSPIWIVQSI